jgi:FixJ family two-component response regulator
MVHVIDDDKFIRRGLDLLFRSAGLDSHAYSSAETFIAEAHLGDYDVIVLDMQMPGMSGCDLLKYLSRHELFLPIIIITAYDEKASRECAKNYGAVAYLRKPVDSQALIDLIKYSVNPV